MSDNVVNLPKQSVPELLVGPFTEYRVVVDERAVPNLTGFKQGDGIWLVVDNRFGCGPFDDATAYQAARLAAEAMAIAAGYSHFAADTRDKPFATRVMKIDAPA